VPLDEHKTRCPYRLAVCRRRRRSVRRSNEVSCPDQEPCLECLHHEVSDYRCCWELASKGQ
jgi:hypothetical protein